MYAFKVKPKESMIHSVIGSRNNAGGVTVAQHARVERHVALAIDKVAGEARFAPIDNFVQLNTYTKASTREGRAAIKSMPNVGFEGSRVAWRGDR